MKGTGEPNEAGQGLGKVRQSQAASVAGTERVGGEGTQAVCRPRDHYKDVRFHSERESHWREALSRRGADLYEVWKGPLWLPWREKGWQLEGGGWQWGRAGEAANRAILLLLQSPCDWRQWLGPEVRVQVMGSPEIPDVQAEPTGVADGANVGQERKRSVKADMTLRLFGLGNTWPELPFAKADRGKYLFRRGKNQLSFRQVTCVTPNKHPSGHVK